MAILQSNLPYKGIYAIEKSLVDMDYSNSYTFDKETETLILFERDSHNQEYRVAICVIDFIHVLMVATYTPLVLNEFIEKYPELLIRRSTEKIGAKYGISKNQKGDEIYVVQADMHLEDLGKTVNKGVFLQRLNAIYSLMSFRNKDRSRYFGEQEI